MNFNDVASSFATLFVLMVVNNWFVICDGYFRLTDSELATTYFIAFFVCANLIVLNLLLAVILGGFGAIAETIEHTYQLKDEHKALRDDQTEVEMVVSNLKHARNDRSYQREE